MKNFDVYRVFALDANDNETWVYNVAVEDYSEFNKLQESFTDKRKYSFFDRFSVFDEELDNIKNYDGIYFIKK